MDTLEERKKHGKKETKKMEERNKNTEKRKKEQNMYMLKENE